MSEFSFSKGTYHPSSSSNTNEDHNNNANMSDPEPMELVVQSVIGQSLESAYGALQTLHESQVVLIARIKIMEEKMKRHRETLKSSGLGKKGESGKIQDCEELINKITSKLQAVTEKMNTIEGRIADSDKAATEDP